MKKTTFAGLIAMAIGVLTLVVIYTFVPTIGSQLATATSVPAAGAGSEWNATLHTDVPTGVGVWTSLAGILKVAAIVEIIAAFLITLGSLSSGRKE